MFVRIHILRNKRFTLHLLLFQFDLINWNWRISNTKKDGFRKCSFTSSIQIWCIVLKIYIHNRINNLFIFSYAKKDNSAFYTLWYVLKEMIRIRTFTEVVRKEYRINFSFSAKGKYIISSFNSRKLPCFKCHEIKTDVILSHSSLSRACLWKDFLVYRCSFIWINSVTFISLSCIFRLSSETVIFFHRIK